LLFLHAISGTWLPAEMQKMSSYSRFRSWQPPADLLNLLRQACYFFAFEDPPPAALMDCLNAAAKSVSSFTTLVGAAMCDSRPNQASSSAGSATVKRPSFLQAFRRVPSVARSPEANSRMRQWRPSLSVCHYRFSVSPCSSSFSLRSQRPFLSIPRSKELSEKHPRRSQILLFPIPDHQIPRSTDHQIPGSTDLPIFSASPCFCSRCLAFQSGRSRPSRVPSIRDLNHLPWDIPGHHGFCLLLAIANWQLSNY